MVKSARQHELVRLSITEHVSQFRELRDTVKFGSVHSHGRIFKNLDEYCNEFQNIGVDTDRFRVLRGLEVDYAPRFEKQVGNFVNRMEWDILLCSVHEFTNHKDVETSITRTDEYDTVGSTEKVWSEYFHLQESALESGFVPFTVLAHPVRMSRGMLQVPVEIDQYLFDLARTAAKQNKALELNGNDIDYAPELVRKLAVACSKAKCKVSVGSDAHRPEKIYQNIERIMGLVNELNLELLPS
jgi:HisJ family histidinol phosphate phosphatase